MTLPIDIPEVARPWGRFRQYAHNDRVTVSLLWVHAGERLSLQSHSGRSELWIVLDEGAEVTVGDWQQADIERYGDDYGRPEHGE